MTETHNMTTSELFEELKKSILKDKEVIKALHHQTHNGGKVFASRTYGQISDANQRLTDMYGRFVEMASDFSFTIGSCKAAKRFVDEDLATPEQLASWRYWWAFEDAAGHGDRRYGCGTEEEARAYLDYLNGTVGRMAMGKVADRELVNIQGGFDLTLTLEGVDKIKKINEGNND